MSFGLEIRDADDFLTFELQGRLVQTVGYVVVTISYNTYLDVTVAGMVDDGTWAAYPYLCLNGQQLAVHCEINTGFIRVHGIRAEGTFSGYSVSYTVYINVIRM